MYEDFLFLIPARGGSKRLPNKNINELNGKPLIFYTFDAIKDIAPIENICFSSCNTKLIQKAEEYGLKVPFVRPAEFASDTSSMLEVIEHAINFYKENGRTFKGLVLLQPTSPLRSSQHIVEALKLFSDNIDLVVSVKITSSNPYYVLFEENAEGFLEMSKEANYTHRQDCPLVYERNGAIYIYNLNGSYQDPKRQIKYVMDEMSSIDIDSEYDWMMAEAILSKKK